MTTLEFFFTFLAFIFLCLVWLGLFAIYAFFCVWGIALVYGYLMGAPFIPSSPKTTEKMLELAGIKRGQVVYDLGCGDGRLVFKAAEMGARAIGVEVNITVYWYALLLKRFHKKSGTFLRRNIFKVDLHDADIVFCYLLNPAMDKLDAKFRNELKKGCKIVSHKFELPGWKAEKEFYSEDGPIGPVKVYTVP